MTLPDTERLNGLTDNSVGRNSNGMYGMFLKTTEWL